MAAKLPAMDESILNMTPMIDIVFQLILFFLFSLKFKDVQFRFDAALPKDRGQQITSTLVEEHPRLVVELFRLDETELDRARTKIKFGGREWMVPSAASLEEREKAFASLRETMKKVSKETGVEEGEIRTPLPSGASVPHADVMKVIDVFYELAAARMPPGFDPVKTPLPPLDVRFFGAPSPLPRAH